MKKYNNLFTMIFVLGITLLSCTQPSTTDSSSEDSAPPPMTIKIL